MTWDPTKPAGADAANTIGTSTPGNFAALDTWASAITTGVAQAGAVIYQMYRSANATIMKLRAAAADTVDRFVCDLNGQMQWGPGNAALDTTLARTGVGVLSLNGLAILNSLFTRYRVNLTADATLTQNAATTVLSQAVTFPSAGGPFRVLVSYAGHFSVSTASSTAMWVSDATNNFAETEAGISANTSDGGFAGIGVSTVTYANSAVITFSLVANSPTASTIIKSLITGGTGTPTLNTHMDILVYPAAN